ncbi:MAG: site-2 protease family protein [Clostridia bacterium]|nr:site-2 protease family protein [Clostridia bacterium]
MLQYLQTLFREPLSFFDQAIYRIAAVLIGLCFHEFAHAYVAHRCGDDTALEAGRMTINPLAHLDPFGTLLMFFAGFGYAKPVPVNPYRFKGDRVRADFLVSIAGICMNLLLFLLFTMVTVACSSQMWDPRVINRYGLSMLCSYRYNAIWEVIQGRAGTVFGDVLVRTWLLPFVRLSAYTALVNLNLAIFNLLPIPPLDGYHVFNDLLFKGRFQLNQMGFRIAMGLVLLLSATGVLGRIISACVYPIQDLVLMPVKALWG